MYNNDNFQGKTIAGPVPTTKMADAEPVTQQQQQQQYDNPEQAELPT